MCCVVSLPSGNASFARPWISKPLSCTMQLTLILSTTVLGALFSSNTFSSPVLCLASMCERLFLMQSLAMRLRHTSSLILQISAPEACYIGQMGPDGFWFAPFITDANSGVQLNCTLDLNDFHVIDFEYLCPCKQSCRINELATSAVRNICCEQSDV